MNLSGCQQNQTSGTVDKPVIRCFVFFSLTQVTAGLSGILKNRMHRLVGFHLEIAEQFGYTQLPGKGLVSNGY